VSDIGINFPFWVTAGFFVVVGWYVSVPAIVVLGVVGCFVYMNRGWRVAAFGTAALLSAPLVVYAVLTINDNAKYRRLQAEQHRTLERDETVAGLALLAGSDIDFTDKSQTQIRLVRLPVVTDIRGVQVTGTLEWQDFSHAWQSTLAGDQIVGGLPCAAGFITFDNDGAVYECKLAAAHAFLGFTLPPRTTLTRGADQAHWSLHLPDNAGARDSGARSDRASGRHASCDAQRMARKRLLRQRRDHGRSRRSSQQHEPLCSRRSRRRALEGTLRGGGRNEAGGYGREHRPHDR
jgi:hypothetical protein